MKKIFCLYLIITLGAHSMQAGIRDDAFKYATATAKCAATTAKGLGAIVCGWIAGAGLCGSLMLVTDSKRIKQELKLKLSCGEKVFNMSLATTVLACGTVSAGCGYLACKLGRSTLQDIGLVARKARK